MPDEKSTAITIEDVAHYPLPGMAVPSTFAFRPDDQDISYLFSAEGSLINNLYTFDPQTREHTLQIEPPGGGVSEQNISREEALRRERQRQRSLGVTTYAWAPHKNMLLVPLRGDLYLQREPGLPLELLFDSAGKPALDPQFSPDGKWIAYVQDAELSILPVEGGQPRQLTYGARGTGKTNGLAEFVAQEEMDRNHGFWWSPDSHKLAFEEVDESHIPVYRIVHQGKDETGETAQEDHHYPFAGKENAHIRLGVVSIEGGKPVWMDLGENKDIYLVRVAWFTDGSLAVQLMNRAQTELRLLRYDPGTGQPTLLLTETSPTWVNLHNHFHALKKTAGDAAGSFIWASERTGFRHLYLYDRDGSLIRPLTAGDWMVDLLVGVDEEQGQVYFTATLSTPLESHLYAVSIDGSEPRCITQEAGIHQVTLDHGCLRFVDVYSTIDHPPVIALRSLLDGALITRLYDRDDPRIASMDLQPPEIVSFHNRSGDLLYGAIYRPARSFGPGPYPTIVQVYGGPHVQSVTNSWAMTVAMRAQYLSSLGYLVFMLDNRGSARRGVSFESAIYHNLGDVEVQDQVDGVRWLVDQGLADPRRVGIYGWSYGGYMAAMALARAPEIFKVAVAGAPVTHEDGYDTFYTERYMGTPQNNPRGYEESSVMHHVANLRGKLMLVHGLIDENVHFRHTARLINALIAARKPYELLLFPDERHMPRREPDRIYMEERIRDFFIENL